MTRMWNAPDAAKAVNGEIVRPGKLRPASGVSTDSRTMKPGDGFVALVGKNFDGHRFAPGALKAGAAWVMVNKKAKLGALPEGGAVIAVDDTLAALGLLARDWRGRFKTKVIGVTGSVGKSTVKEMCALVLSAKGRALKNQGNFNNRIGLPRTIFEMNGRQDFAVLEMGTNEPGEIEALARAAAPDAGIITRVAAVHLEGLGSIEGVAREKAGLIRGLGPKSIFILNLDDPRIVKHAKSFPGRVIGFSARPDAAFAGEWILADGFEKEVLAGAPFVRFQLRRMQGKTRAGKPLDFILPGLAPHNAANAAAAAALGLGFGVSLAESSKRLRGFKGLSGRNEVARTKSGAIVLNDTYNSSPAAVAAALETVAWWKGPMRGVAVLGEMRELGPDAEKLHREIGKKAAACGIGLLLAKGSLGRAVVEEARGAGVANARVVRDNGEAVKVLKNKLQRGDWILVKGSRATAMEDVVREITR